MLAVYIREAHAKDVWPVGDDLNITTPKQIEDRITAAKQLVHDLHWPNDIPIFCDNMNDDFEAKFAGWPTRFWVLHNQKFAHISVPNNDGTYDLTELIGCVATIVTRINQIKSDNEGIY